MYFISRVAMAPVWFVCRFWHVAVGLAALAFSIVTMVFAIRAEPAGVGGQIFRFGVIGFGLGMFALVVAAVEVERRLWLDRFPGWFVCTGDARLAVWQRYGLQWLFGLSGVMFSSLSLSCAAAPDLYSYTSRLVFAILGQIIIIACLALVFLVERETRRGRRFGSTY